jgi:hypothetical protein
MIIAVRAHPLVLDQFDFVNDFVTSGTFLKKSLRNVALLAVLNFDRGFFEDGHGLCARRGHGVN